MPWSETNRMEERARFVLDALRGHFTMTELCERYGVSRKTGYKWVARYHGEGAHGCNYRLRSPRNHPNKTKELIAKKIILARRKRPGWGPVTLRAMLLEKYLALPEHDRCDPEAGRVSQKASEAGGPDGLANAPDSSGSSEPSVDGGLQGTGPARER